jgi:dienelactone hydrolase
LPIFWVARHSLKAGLAALLAALVAGCADPGPAPPLAGESSFEKVVIPLIKEGGPVAKDVAVTGYLFRPASSGPFPSVILIPGCNGLDWSLPHQPGWMLMKRYAERYQAHDYVALVLDSFAPRGVDNVCGRPLLVSAVRRAWDVFSAARYLGSLGYVDGSRLVLQGDSHGGWTTLVALEAGRWQVSERFAAAIAWYPSCYPAPGFTAPILVLIGDKDDWTPAEQCRALAERLHGQPGGAELVLKVFPNATHAYDFPLPARTNRLGHYMTYDAGATAASWEAIDAFLAAHVK